MLFAPGSTPEVTAEQAFELEAIRRQILQFSPKEAAAVAVKLRRENQLLRTALTEICHELDRVARFH